MIRTLAALAAAGLLSACNMVISPAPMFFAADEAGAPRLREGLWLKNQNDAEQPCAVEVDRPVETWPPCADAFVVRGSEILSLERDGATASWDSIPYVLAAGDPPVWQIPLPKDEGKVVGYAFLGMEAVRTDEAGRIIEYRAWPVLCGPPPPPGTQVDGKARYGTLEPLSGLIMEPAGDNCTPEDAKAVRGAVQASRAWQDAAMPGARWVRDGIR